MPEAQIGLFGRLNAFRIINSCFDVSKYTWCLTSTETVRLIRDGENGGKGYGGGGEGDYIPIAPRGREESHFNVSVGSYGQNHRTVSTNHNLFEEKKEPKGYRTEVLPLTSLTP